MTDDRQQDVSFEPVRIGRRRRGPDPFMIGVAVVIGGLLLAVIKPWQGPDTAAGSSPSPLAVASASPAASDGEPVPETPGTILFDDPLATVTVLDALGSHDVWGIRAVERAPDFRTGYRERWIWAPASEVAEHVVSIPAGAPTLALGITTPADETPLDVRVYGAAGADGWSWLDVHRVTTDRPEGSLLLRPPRVHGVDQAAWPAGTYRVELLMGAYIETIDLTLASATAVVPGPPVRLDPPHDALDGAVPIESIRDPGPVLMDGSVALPLDVASHGPLEAVDAWFDAVGPDAAALPPVATIAPPAGPVLAVLLPAGATAVDAAVSRISPTGSFDPPTPTFIADLGQGTLPIVAFLVPDGRSWEPGTYAMDVHWRDDAGPHDGTWHVSLLPGEPDPEPALLRAARAFDSVARRDGIVVGPTFGRDAGPRGDAAHYIAFERPGGGADALPIACGETFIGGKPEVVGISHPIEARTSSVSLSLLVPGGDPRPVPLRTAELEGLTLLEPARGASFAQGIYKIAIVDETGRMTAATMCLGTSPFEG